MANGPRPNGKRPAVELDISVDQQAKQPNSQKMNQQKNTYISAGYKKKGKGKEEKFRALMLAEPAVTKEL